MVKFAFYLAPDGKVLQKVDIERIGSLLTSYLVQKAEMALRLVARLAGNQVCPE